MTICIQQLLSDVVYTNIKALNKWKALPCHWASNKNSCIESHTPLSCSTKTSRNQSIQGCIHASIRHDDCMIFSSYIGLKELREPPVRKQIYVNVRFSTTVWTQKKCGCECVGTLVRDEELLFTWTRFPPATAFTCMCIPAFTVWEKEREIKNKTSPIIHYHHIEGLTLNTWQPIRGKNWNQDLND